MITKEILKDIKELPPGIDELGYMFESAYKGDPTQNFYNEKTKLIKSKISLNISKCSSLFNNMNNTLQGNGDSNDITKYIIEINTEMAMALGRTISLLTRLNIDISDIKNYYESVLKERNLYEGYYFEDSPLKTSMQYGKYCNILSGVYNNHMINLRPIRTWKDPEDTFMKGGRICNEDYIKELYFQSYEFLLNLTLIHDETKTDDVDFIQKQGMLAWLYLMKLLDFLQHDQDSVGRLFTIYDYILLTKK